jgi:AraC-like DNA-binding protein
MMDGSPKQDKSEFDYLEDSVSFLVEENQFYEMRIREQLPFLIQSTLIKSLLGTFYTEQAFTASCQANNLTFSSNQFLVIILSIKSFDPEKISGSLVDLEKPSNEDPVVLAYYITGSILQDLMSKSSDCYHCYYDEHEFLIVSLKGTDIQPNVLIQTIKDSVLECETLAFNQYHISSSFYISGIYVGSKGIHEAYLESMWGIEQMEGFLFADRIMCAADLATEALTGDISSNQIYSSSRRRQLSNFVFSGNIESADETLISALSDGIARLDPSFSNIKLHGIALLDYLLSNLDIPRQDHTPDDFISLIGAIRDSKNLDEFELLMHHAFELLYQRHLLSATPTDSNRLGDEVLRYVNEHYTDPNLSVSSIADHFGVSNSYLLRVFKKSETRGVLEYIHFYRVEQAKLLLQDKNNTVSDTAQSVGYTNALALIRAFKRLEGVTPTDYRAKTYR